MPISSRPSIESFINKGGSSSNLEALAAADVKTEKAAKTVKRTGVSKKSKTDKVVQKAVLAPNGKALGRPRKVVEAETLKFVMRIPIDISSELDTGVSQRKIPVSRNAWILEAIVEKLGREILKN